MAINATNSGQKRELIPAGNYVARCYQMVHIGTVQESFQGETKDLNKVRIGWELPTELKVFNEEAGEQPLVISKEFTLSMNEKSNLRKALASWRGKDFTEEEARKFDVTVLLGKPCMLNIIHKPKASDPSTIYAEIGSISPMPKGFNCPDQVMPTVLLDYDNWDDTVFSSLPDFLKDKIKQSAEYKKRQQPAEVHSENGVYSDTAHDDDLPF